MDRRAFLKATGAAALLPALDTGAPVPKPNVVLILVDDMGYGDLSCYGSQIETPNFDRMAQEGVLFTHFYAASPVCSPSRAALLTGKYGVRVGVPTVFTPTDTVGLSLTEMTMADILKAAGYRTMCVGKWHLGRPLAYLPTKRGFDQYYGIPYSNDQEPSILMHNTDIIESPVNLTTLTKRYTVEAINFIQQSESKPFFLYFAHTFPHIPLAVSPDFAGKSGMGLYGDVIQELDWSLGQVLQTLKDTGSDANTLVLFTSDNGPWFQGSPGRLRGRKGDTFDGGMREPFIARFPGRIPPAEPRDGGILPLSSGATHHPAASLAPKMPGIRTVDTLASTMDLLPTIAGFAGISLSGTPMDGVDIGPILTGQVTDVTRPLFLYFSYWDLQCARTGPWKLHVSRSNVAAYSAEPKVGYFNLRLTSPELYNMESDPEEAEDVSSQHPDIVASIQQRILAMLPTLPVEVQNAWKKTQNTPVYNNESGAYPSPILP